MTVGTPTDNPSVTRGIGSEAPVYLDNNATTPVDPRVAAEVLEYMAREYGNAGSRTHSYGQNAKQRVNRAREEVAAVAAARPDEVTFTSGATESDNLALLGLLRFGQERGRRHIVSTAIEHKAVLEPLEELGKRGFDVTLVDPEPGGWVSPDAIANALRPDTLLVSVMSMNNETGVVQPVEQIASILDDHEAFFHVDAAQSFGKILGPLQNPRIDLISVSGHKLFAPKGIGALIVRRRGFKRIPLQPLMFGGGQERGLRPGTLPVPLIAGLGTACRLAVEEHAERYQLAVRIKQDALSALNALPIFLNGDADRTAPNTLNLTVPGVDSEAAIVALKDMVAISNGSACTSQKYEPSHVLVAANLPEEQINGALRISWSHLTPAVPWLQVAKRLAMLQSQ